MNNLQDYALAELKLIKANKEDQINAECRKTFDADLKLAASLAIELGGIIGAIQDKKRKNKIDLFSTLSNAEVNKSMAFRHNQKDSCLMFYGMQDEMELSIIVNGSGSEGVGPTTEKEFLAYNIDSLQHEFSAVRYQTEFQLSDKIPFRENARFWANPEYLEHTWQCPIFIKTDPTNQTFYPNSSMRGKWMKLTLFYRQNIPTFVKTILSFFNSSHA